MRAAVLTVLLGLLLAAPASALPGDPPIVPLTPADRASVAPREDIPVTYSCPAYTVAVYGDPDDPLTDRGDHENYDVAFSSLPGLAADGRLAVTPFGSTGGPSLAADGTTCTSTLRPATTASPTGVFSGRVYWQPYRYCNGCAKGWETGPVRSFVIRPVRVAAKIEVPRRIYAGYQNVFGLRTKTRLSGEIELQRRVGRRWRQVGREGSVTGRTDIFATLPGGRQTLRAVVVAPGGMLVVATRRVVVARSVRRVTSGDDDGSYGDRKGSSGLRFTVARGGRLLRDFVTPVTQFCFGATVEDNRIFIGFAAVRPVPIAPDGSVVGRLRLKGGRTDATLVGHLRGRRFHGEATLLLGGCYGVRKIDAIRKR